MIHAPMTTPEVWSLLVGDLGRIAIWLAFLLNVVAVVLWWLQPQNPRLAKWAGLSFTFGVIAFFAAFISLASLFLTSQFHFEYVWKHSALDHAWKYKLSGVWSGQEGSFLLWALGSSLFGVLAAPRTGLDRRWFTIILALFLACIAGILNYESPFNLVPLLEGKLMTPPDGRGMPPTLLNYWVTIHPPTIFLGFGCLAVLYSWAMAALLRNDLKSWVDGVRSWSLIALTLVGVGLCMGGFWAYETLGWGGFWMWDPVENTSFVPWALVAAFVHGIFIQKAKGKWQHANVALGALPFLAFCYGTFLTRSGFLGDSSVHTFAEMDRTALQILVGIGGVALVAFLATLITRLIQERDRKQAEPEIADTEGILQKQSFYGAAVWLLTASGVIAAIGMSVPIFVTLTKVSLRSVTEHQYHQAMAWPFPFIMLAMGIAPFLTWRAAGFKVVFGKLLNVLAVSIGLVGVLLLWLKNSDFGVAAKLDEKIHFFGDLEVSNVAWILILTWLCIFCLLANALRMIQLWRTARPSVGGLITHIGVAVTMFGLIFSRGLEQKTFVLVHPTKNDTAFGYHFDLIGPTKSFTDPENKVELRVINDQGFFIARPGLYFQPGENGEPSPIMWPHIQRWPLFDIYITLGQMAWEATESIEFRQGDQRLFQDTLLTYEGLRTEGEVGTTGATFIADVKAENGTDEQVISPSIKIVGEGQLQHNDAPLTKDLKLRLDRIDANTGSVFLSVTYVQPAYPLEVFYKPLTWLVWLGVGIMTVGGFVSARYRRQRAISPGDRTSDTSDEPAETTHNETESVTEV